MSEAELRRWGYHTREDFEELFAQIKPRRTVAERLNAMAAELYSKPAKPSDAAAIWRRWNGAR